MDFLRAAAAHHEDGLVGVITDAVKLYRDKIEAKRERILDGIGGN